MSVLLPPSGGRAKARRALPRFVLAVFAAAERLADLARPEPGAPGRDNRPSPRRSAASAALRRR